MFFSFNGLFLREKNAGIKFSSSTICQTLTKIKIKASRDLFVEISFLLKPVTDEKTTKQQVKKHVWLNRLPSITGNCIVRTTCKKNDCKKQINQLIAQREKRQISL